MACSPHRRWLRPGSAGVGTRLDGWVVGIPLMGAGALAMALDRPGGRGFRMGPCSGFLRMATSTCAWRPAWSGQVAQFAHSVQAAPTLPDPTRERPHGGVLHTVFFTGGQLIGHVHQRLFADLVVVEVEELLEVKG